MNTKRDTFADGFVHVAGLAFSLPATAVLLHSTQDTPLLFLATAVYCASMVTAFGASLLYHLSPVVRFEAMLGRIDHAAIYLKIAGTYTPFVVLIGSALAYTVLAVVWLIALIGVVAKLRGWAADARGSLALYLGMGWLSVLLLVPMWRTLPPIAVSLIVAGGVIYSLGTLVYARPNLPYRFAIWHGFVLTASICFFTALLLSI